MRVEGRQLIPMQWPPLADRLSRSLSAYNHVTLPPVVTVLGNFHSPDHLETFSHTTRRIASPEVRHEEQVGGRSARGSERNF